MHVLFFVSTFAAFVRVFFVVHTPNARNLTTVILILLREFLATALLSSVGIGLGRVGLESVGLGWVEVMCDRTGVCVDGGSMG